MTKSKTVDYSEELYSKVMDNMLDYHQTGETVCGANDPAVISVQPLTGYEEFGVVRVVDRYVNPWKSDTLLVFSNVAMTPEEYEDSEGYDGE